SKSGVPMNTRRIRMLYVPPLPPDIDPVILAYARQVRSLNVGDDIGAVSGFAGSLEPSSLTKAAQKQLVDHIVSWTGHRSSYDNFLKQPIARVRKGLQLLFDPSVDLESRLETLQGKGYLKGLRMPSLSLLLYWRDPKH